MRGAGDALVDPSRQEQPHGVPDPTRKFGLGVVGTVHQLYPVLALTGVGLLVAIVLTRQLKNLKCPATRSCSRSRSAWGQC